ncbi:MAG: HIT domain-containing protein [Nanoarchaeota archaeon]|nr:HIT domain-containing protein [Nanoarchaeota archaeon]MBU1051468.1 HIT domain-containing protein [Nanoarchaeota archaeon]
MKEPDCGLCREVSATLEKGRLDRKIEEIENFVAFVSAGPLTLGHLLITSKEHYISMATIPEVQFDELRTLREKLGERLTSAFNLPQTVLFEHGPSKYALRGGCCVDHAHLHIMPVRLPSTRVVSKIKKALGEPKIIESYRGLGEFEDGETAYAFFEFDGIRYLFEVSKPMPSQFVRQIIGKYIGRQYTWDWRQNPRIEDILENVERLKARD